jgi:hypothetical protein
MSDKNKTRGLLLRGSKGEVYFIHDVILPFCEIKDPELVNSLSKILNDKTNLQSMEVFHVTINDGNERTLKDNKNEVLKKLGDLKSIDPNDLYVPW